MVELQEQVMLVQVVGLVLLVALVELAELEAQVVLAEQVGPVESVLEYRASLGLSLLSIT
jgi:hypothetical protein